MRLSFKRANERRTSLITKATLGNGLSIPEWYEMEWLQAFVSHHIDRRYPMPLDRLRRILAKARKLT